MSLSYGAKRPNRPGTAIVLAEGERVTTLIVRLPRGAVITGTILDQSGDAMSGATVSILRSAFGVNGQRQLQLVPAGSGQTDDRGQYRLWGLAAGEYVVSAMAPSMGFGQNAGIARVTDADVKRALTDVAAAAPAPGIASSGGVPRAGDARPRTVGYAAVYYPGTFVQSQAIPVKIEAGEERSGIDVSITLVPTAKVEGTIAVPEGVNPTSLMLQMIASGPASFSMMGGVRRTNSAADGTFAFAGVAPGVYTIAVRAALPMARTNVPSPSIAPAAPVPPTLWATAEVAVDGQDVAGVALTLQHGVTISGRLQFEGSRSPPDPSRFRIMLMPVQGPGEVSIGVSAAAVNTNGTFALVGVAPGRYRLNATFPSLRNDGSAWQLKSSMVNGEETADVAVDVRDSIDGAVITFTDRVSELGGRVQDASGHAAPDFGVLAFARDRALWAAQSRRIRFTKPAVDGTYSFANLAPGDYFLVAVNDLEPGEWYDPALLEQLSRTALRITLAEGEKKVQDLRLAVQIP